MSEARKRPENTFLSKRVIANGTVQANRKNNWLPIFFPPFFSLHFVLFSLLLSSFVYLYFSLLYSTSLGPSTNRHSSLCTRLRFLSISSLRERERDSSVATFLQRGNDRFSLSQALDCALTSWGYRWRENPSLFIPYHCESEDFSVL